jgi:hypothetical protein
MRQDDWTPGTRNWFMITVLASLAIGAAVVVVLTLRGEGPLAQHAELSDFTICQGPDPVTGRPQGSYTTLPPDGAEIYACGYLETAGSVSLSFLLLFEDQPVDWFVLSRPYQTGYLYEPIPLAGPEPGTYRVEAHLSRGRLGSAEVVVLDEQQ